MISIEGLSKFFKQDKKQLKAVDNLNLKINRGEIYGIIGYSGAGKSTFVRLINRLEEPTSGKVIIDNQEITSLKSNELRLARREIGMIFQHFNLLWSRTVKENIAFPLEIAGVSKEEREKRVQELIHLVGLTGRENAYPSQLSGGQKQRVGIARALANKPKVLLCDEATSALDPETTNSILELLVDINAKMKLTIILITHEMHVIRKICSSVAVMENGKVVEQGDVLNVFQKPQQPVTKKFVEQVMGNNEDNEVINQLITNTASGKILRLQFIGETTNQALISEVSRKFNVDINILQGKITQTQHGAFGTLYVQMNGENEVIKNACQFIENETSVELEVIENAI
ncbi:methionine ABC transporter ATP-binding protein [Oceanobacillus chungangensis]|uniref:Methionine ABC transporter ATP-binding protein n=1 Tax=Oceanobacillus chungangensis TaxID=1229152 RepID=A0A3D8PYP9_9BACI|nr:methionine ABC transporter ATP-binding protein [Oceanobacillus chungangensis]RDW20932.1 methionine ABC transporter ATP-binding protein [Oceanobacillus chungangensis]